MNEKERKTYISATQDIAFTAWAESFQAGTHLRNLFWFKIGRKNTRRAWNVHDANLSFSARIASVYLNTLGEQQSVVQSKRARTWSKEEQFLQGRAWREWKWYENVSGNVRTARQTPVDDDRHGDGGEESALGAVVPTSKRKWKMNFEKYI